MNKAKPKALKTTTESTEIKTTIEPPILQEVSKKVAKKSPAEKFNAIIEPAKANEAIEKTVKSTTKKTKIPKVKVIRDSFSFPEQDYLKISELKKTCLAAGIHVKKSEILRAGLHLLTGLKLADLKIAVENVEKVQTGRPSTSEAE
jgi:hypothetical protein